MQKERNEATLPRRIQRISLFATRITFQLRKLDSNKSRFWIRSKKLGETDQRGNWTNAAAKREEEYREKTHRVPSRQSLLHNTTTVRLLVGCTSFTIGHYHRATSPRGRSVTSVYRRQRMPLLFLVSRTIIHNTTGARQLLYPTERLNDIFTLDRTQLE